MNYELAKKLKDAGWRQKRGFGVAYLYEKERHICSGPEADSHCACPSCYGYDADYAVEPTLSELIEACGDRFGKLISPTYRRRYDGIRTYWTAMSDDDRTDFYDTDGSTPEEAVANLWLELQKK